MNATRSVVVERDIPHPPEKIWRALTQPHLIEEWLAKTDFKPVAGHRFSLRADQPLFYGGARAGWQQFVANLEQVVARLA